MTNQLILDAVFNFNSQAYRVTLHGGDKEFSIKELHRNDAVQKLFKETIDAMLAKQVVHYQAGMGLLKSINNEGATFEQPPGITHAMATSQPEWDRLKELMRSPPAQGPQLSFNPLTTPGATALPLQPQPATPAQPPKILTAEEHRDMQIHLFKKRCLQTADKTIQLTPEEEEYFTRLCEAHPHRITDKASEINFLDELLRQKMSQNEVDKISREISCELDARKKAAPVA